MTPIHRVLDQIRWDPRLSRCRFELAWLERGGELVREPVVAFRTRGEVPLHRVQRLWCDGVLVWDRETRLDTIDALADRVASREPVRSAAFWNVEEPAYERIEQIIEAVLALDADIVGLAEVGAHFLDALRARLGAGHVLLSVGSLAAVLPVGQGDAQRCWSAVSLPLPGREALLAVCEDITVAVAHLTSDIRGDRSLRRSEQLSALARALPVHGTLLVLLDANTERALHELDSLSLADPGSPPTFDPAHNSRARSRNPAPRRLDRVLVRGLSAQTGTVVRYEGPAGPLSDHWPVRVALGEPAESEKYGRSSGTALAIVPPASIAARLDVIRADRDEAYARWPAHINVLHPFVSQEHLSSVLPELAIALAAADPPEIGLSETAHFAHAGGRFTVWAKPDDAAPLRTLRRRIEGVLPHLQDGMPYTPHLTLATGVGPVIDVDLAADQPLRFRAPAVVLLAKVGERYTEVDHVPFGESLSLSAALSETGLLAEEDEICQQIIATLRATLPGELVVVGSVASGLRLSGGDIDLLWRLPSSNIDPEAVMTERLAMYAPRKLETLTAPRIKLTVHGIEVDLLLGGHEGALADTERATALSEDQRLAVVTLKVWAARRGLPIPASVGWLDLVAVAPEQEAIAIVLSIWRRLADTADELVLAGSAFRGARHAQIEHLRREAASALAMAQSASPPWRALLRSGEGR